MAARQRGVQEHARRTTPAAAARAARAARSAEDAAAGTAPASPRRVAGAQRAGAPPAADRPRVERPVPHAADSATTKAPAAKSAPKSASDAQPPAAAAPTATKKFDPAMVAAAAASAAAAANAAARTPVGPAAESPTSTTAAEAPVADAPSASVHEAVVDEAQVDEAQVDEAQVPAAVTPAAEAAPVTKPARAPSTRPRPVPSEPDAAAAPDGGASIWERIRHPSRDSRRGILIGCVAALLVAGVVAVVLTVTSNSKPGSAALGSAAPAASGQTGQTGQAAAGAAPSAASSPTQAIPAVIPARAYVTRSEDWLNGNVDHGAVLATDPAIAAELRTAGFSRVHPLPTAAGPDWRADAFLIATPAARVTAAAAGTPAAAELASSVPVAVFGTGTDRVEVRKVFADGLGDLAARRSQDATQRQTAGTLLSRNRHLHVDTATAAVLRSGALDLRAATFLAFLADRTDVQLTGVQADAGETAAGLPARTITVSVSQPAIVSEVVNTLPASFQPLRVTPLAGGLDRIRWDIAAVPVPTVS